jgi:hypothetical protein
MTEYHVIALLPFQKSTDKGAVVRKFDNYDSAIWDCNYRNELAEDLDSRLRYVVVEKDIA